MPTCGDGTTPCDPCGSGWGSGGWNGGPIEAGPGLHIYADKAAFTYRNGVLDPSFQTIEFIATISGIESPVSWVISDGIAASTEDVSRFTLNSDQMGQRFSVAVTATTPNGEARTIFVYRSADPGATIGAPVGTPFGTRLVEEVLLEIEESRARINDLITTFGASQAAGEAAAVAQLILEAVERAQEATDQAVALTDLARDDAIEEAQRAAGAATVALAYRNQIIDIVENFDGEGGNLAEIIEQAGIAATAALDAQTAATAAVAAAQTATARATEAEQSATAAQAERITAETAASNAAASATQAATSEDNAAGSAASASMSAGVAVDSAGSAQTSASAAATSSSTASSAATDAMSAASSATNAANTATARAGEATTAASSATSSAAVATSQAAAAQTSAVLAANVGTGALNPNPGFDDYPSGAVGALPGSWGLWVSAGHYRVSDGLGGYSLRMPAPANQEAGLQWTSASGAVKQNDFFVLEADITLNSGSLLSAGVLFFFLDFSGEWIAQDNLFFWQHPDSTGNVVGAGEAGKTYRFRRLVRAVSANSTFFRIYPMSKWTGFGPIDHANDITWHKCLVRPATQAEIRDQTVLAPLQATVSTQAGVLADLQGRTEAYWQVVAGAGGSSAVIAARASGTGSTIAMVANRVVIANQDGSGMRDALVMENGNATFAGQLRAGSITADKMSVSSLSALTANIGEVTAGVLRSPNNQARLELDNARIIFNNGSFMKVTGLGFGSANQFIEWSGPSQANLNNCTEANAVTYLKTNGEAYFGGALSIGVRKNAIQSTLIAENVDAILGPFGSVTGSRNVTCSYSFDWRGQHFDGQGQGGSGSTTAQLQVWREMPGLQGWTVINSFNVQINASWGPSFNTAEPGPVSVSGSGSITFTDPTTFNGNMTYLLRLLSRPLPTVPPFSAPINQSLGIVSTQG